MNRLQGINFGLLKSKVVLIVTGLVIVLLIVWWFAWMTPEASKLTTVQQQVTADSSTVTQLNLELYALKAEKKLVLHELPYLKKVTTAIPPTEDPPASSTRSTPWQTRRVATSCRSPRRTSRVRVA